MRADLRIMQSVFRDTAKEEKANGRKRNRRSHAYHCLGDMGVGRVAEMGENRSVPVRGC